MLYSSVASLFGNIGQTNYSAANAYLDELARWRVSQGLGAVSVQWPAVSGVGMVAAMDASVRIAEKMSVGEATVKAVVRQLLIFSSVTGEALEATTMTSVQCAVQAVVPRGMLEAGLMPDHALGPLLSKVQVSE